MAEFRLQKGSIVPLHSHPHEQAGYLVSGQLKFTVGSEEIVCTPGDSWCIAGDKVIRSRGTAGFCTGGGVFTGMGRLSVEIMFWLLGLHHLFFVLL